MVVSFAHFSFRSVVLFPIYFVVATILTQLGLESSPSRAGEQTVVGSSKPTEQDRDFQNSIGMKLIRIEPGSFQMGSKTGDFDEQPVRKVTISQPFLMATTEVTNKQYEQFDPKHRKLRGKYGYSKEDDDAVVFVSWQQAANFCKWLAMKEGRPYRLPTEAEWEYACRAGTDTRYSTGDTLPPKYLNRDGRSLKVGQTPANPWGLMDMHGNVEEWCHDWYGPYQEGEVVDPVGYATGDFRVSRGGSHSNAAPYLRSANRQGSLPGDRQWLTGFRVVIGTMPMTKPLPVTSVPTPLWAKNVKQKNHNWNDGPDPKNPYFVGPRQYVFIPPDADGPLFAKHNHQPAITACPNGDLLAIWYTCRTEPGRELAVAASRLRHGKKQWEPAAPFWDAPDRNDHGNALLWDGKKTLFHFNGLAVDSGWGNLALIMRKSTDNGATWSKARIISGEHKPHHQVIEGAFVAENGDIIVPCDAVPGGNGGSVIHISRNGGKSWLHPAANRMTPKFNKDSKGAWIAGIHAGVTRLKNGDYLAFGRGDSIDGKMPMSISKDKGLNWSYHASDFPPIGGGQRLVLEQLKEGPLFFASFAKNLKVKDADGKERLVNGLFGAVSYDGGKTWPVKKLITDGQPARTVDGGGNTGKFTMSPTSSEPRGYMACTQAPDGVIHLISSKQHYAFNLKWLESPMPGESK